MEMRITTPAMALALVNLTWIAVLARVFFLPGQFNLRWWLNTAPFVLAGAALLGVQLGVLSPYPAFTERAGGMAILAILLCASAQALMGYALGTHRIRLALWQQSDDAPEHIVTEGAYGLVRHPFYTSYLLTMVGCVLAAPTLWTVAALAYSFHRMNATAAREESRFLASSFGESYSAYMRHTGRFVPAARARSSA